MKTTVEAPAKLLSGRIFHVVYRVVGDATERAITTGLNENVSDAVSRHLFLTRRVAVTRINTVELGRQYEYQFADGLVLYVEIL